uniref:inositol-phosphate phosphatase n=1 Tax=Phallusia mammillata TaxID=59560 RepID=A0A6F9DEG0_9ASCI|nr:inositol monophosphatase 3-like [Phallusia mammillata]
MISEMQSLANKMAPPGVHPSKTGMIIILLCLAASVIYFSTSLRKSNVVDMKMLLIASIDFAERGGDQVRLVQESGKLSKTSKGKTLEGADNPLTQGDMRSHRAITQAFAYSFPSLKVISEEKDSAHISTEDIPLAPMSNKEVDYFTSKPFQEVDVNDITVWVDPLDATQEFTEGLDEYVTTMVCVAVNGKPVIGVIHKPFEKKTYWSWVGHGSNIQDDSKFDTGTKIIVSRSHAGEVKETAKKSFGENVEVIPAGGAGYKSLALFNGVANAYIHTTLIKKWDICAGNAILNHAKGKMTTLKGEEIDYSSETDPKNHGGLLAALHQHKSFLDKLA